MQYKVDLVATVWINADCIKQAHNVATDKVMSIMKAEFRGVEILVVSNKCQELKNAHDEDTKPKELKENVKAKRKRKSKV